MKTSQTSKEWDNCRFVFWLVTQLGTNFSESHDSSSIKCKLKFLHEGSEVCCILEPFPESMLFTPASPYIRNSSAAGFFK